MKVSGFTFIRNAILYDYPVVEAITSILPLCDEFIVAVGNSDDGTFDLIQSIPSDKIRIKNTMWDDTLRMGGRVFALETDKAFQEIAKDTTWAFYIQGDEVVHEKYLPEIQKALIRYKNSPEVEGLLFSYLHFGLAFILVFVGVKMLLADFYKIPVTVALAVVGVALMFE